MALVSTGSAGCRDSSHSAGHSSDQVTLTVGVGQLSATNQVVGLRKIARNLAIEELVSLGRDGRPAPRLAQSLTTTPDGRVLRIRLRPGVTFHDGTPVTSTLIAELVKAELPGSLGPAFADVEDVRAISDHEIEITQKKASPFLAESLDFEIQKPGSSGIGTGAFAVAAVPGQIEMTANTSYYLGRPAIDRIVMRSYPTVRAAWADMLRGQVDMLYEVGLDALDSLLASSQVSIFTFPRNYAYVVIMNTGKPMFASRDVRRALNLAIDRRAVIQEALNNHATPDEGPVPPQHWAYRDTLPTFHYEPASAAKVLTGHTRFKCLFAAGAVYERLALSVQKQLAAVGVVMDIEAVPLDQFHAAVQGGNFDAVLTDAQIGPNLFRSYQWWHSGGPFNAGKFSSARVDDALDSIRYASSDQEYASAVLQFQQAMIDDPPAVFIAWGQRARAVSRRFDVPAEPGRDVLGTLRLFKLATNTRASRN
jgi:peptide/nickel transport system substrate-binding protein